MGRFKCGSCEACFSAKETHVECSACHKKYHEKCSKLSDIEFKTVASKSSRLKWFCDLCNKDVENMLDNYDRFRKVSAEISKIKTEMVAKLEEYDKRLLNVETASNKPNNVEQKIVEQVKRSNDEDKEEHELIKAKEQNIIFFNVPESESDIVAERMKSDFELVKTAYNGELNHTDISSMYRVGKKAEKDRPLVIRFNNIEMRNAVLKKSSDLKIKVRNEIKPIYASIDRTNKQREIHKKLVEELKKRKSEGEQNIVIRNNKIVKIFQKENAAQRTTWANLFI